MAQAVCPRATNTSIIKFRILSARLEEIADLSTIAHHREVKRLRLVAADEAHCSVFSENRLAIDPRDEIAQANSCTLGRAARHERYNRGIAVELVVLGAVAGSRSGA